MEFWEITSKRAQQTLAVWSRHAPGMRIGKQGPVELRQMIAGFRPQVQARAAANSAYWEAFYQGQAALRELKQLALKLTRLLQGHLDEGAPLMPSLHAACRVAPRTEATILQRLRALLPVWAGLNATRAAFSPPEPPVPVIRQGRGLDVAAVHGLLAAYARQAEVIQEKAALLRQARAALRIHDRAADRLNKRWYRSAKASAREGSALADALHGMTTTTTAPAERSRCSRQRRGTGAKRRSTARSAARRVSEANQCERQALARHRCRVPEGDLRPQIVLPALDSGVVGAGLRRAPLPPHSTTLPRLPSAIDVRGSVVEPERSGDRQHEVLPEG